MSEPLDDRPLSVQVAWLATGFSVPDLGEAADLLGREPADPEFLAAWRACGLRELAEDVPWW